MIAVAMMVAITVIIAAMTVAISIAAIAVVTVVPMVAMMAIIPTISAVVIIAAVVMVMMPIVAGVDKQARVGLCCGCQSNRSYRSKGDSRK